MAALYNISGKVAIVTGGANGIGAAIVKALLEEGAKHVAILDVATKPGNILERELCAKYGTNRAQFIESDVTEDKQLFGAFDRVIKEMGYIDIVVNNAGIMNDSMEMYKKAIAVNVTALISSTLKAIDVMRTDKGGRGGTVVNVSSLAGLTKYHVMPTYWAAKLAVAQFSNCIGMEPHYSRTGVRVFSACFGKTKTDLIQDLKSFDELTTSEISKSILEISPSQTANEAATGVVKAIKEAGSSTIWIIASGKPAKDITTSMDKAYQVLLQGIIHSKPKL